MTQHRPRLVSGIQPTGTLHIGNLIGTMSHWVPLQETHDCMFPIVDLHAITVRQDPSELRERSLDFAAQYLAVGIDPLRSIVFIQSQVAEHAELAWILSCFTQFGELSRMTQFKEKSQRHTSNINAGLFSYPTLMAADILLYNADLVPVGADQKQHLELTRDIAIRFNALCGDTFRVPEPMTPTVGARIMKLGDPTSKMSKTDEDPNNFIALLDSPDRIRTKLKRAQTDSVGLVKSDEARPAISNLMTMFRAISGEDFAVIESRFAGRGYGDFKAALVDIVIQYLAPIQQRYRELRDDEKRLGEILEDGANRATERAREIMVDVFRKVGFPPPRNRR